MEKTTGTVPVRELMPDGFLNTISQETGMDGANISKVITNEKRSSYIWPVVERLATETDPRAYAARIKFLEKRDKAQKAFKQAQRRAAAA